MSERNCQNCVEWFTEEEYCNLNSQMTVDPKTMYCKGKDYKERVLMNEFQIPNGKCWWFNNDKDIIELKTLKQLKPLICEHKDNDSSKCFKENCPLLKGGVGR